MTASYESTTSRLAQQELGACTLIQDLLPLYMDGEVSPSSRETIAEHLTRCERCAGFLAGARSMHTQLRREGALRASLAAQDQSTRQAVDLGRRRLRWLVVGGLTAMLGFGFLVMMALMVFGVSGSSAPAPMMQMAPTAVPPSFDSLAPGGWAEPPVSAMPLSPEMDPQMQVPPQAIPAMPGGASNDLALPTLVPAP
jgi:anti-sigma factor RsiW